MGDERDSDRRARREDEKVQEEIRRLFARYRRLARRAVTTPNPQSRRKPESS
jgi:hypothetical protein